VAKPLSRLGLVSVSVRSAHGRLDPPEKTLVARPVISLSALQIRWGTSHSDMALFLLLSDEGCLLDGVRSLRRCRWLDRRLHIQTACKPRKWR